MVIEHRRKASGLADLLLYDSIIDDGVLLLQDGALLAGWAFRGPDMASATHAEMAALSARLNSILRLGSGWLVQVDAIRSASPGYPEKGAFPDLRHDWGRIACSSCHQRVLPQGPAE